MIFIKFSIEPYQPNRNDVNRSLIISELRVEYYEIRDHSFVIRLQRDPVIPNLGDLIHPPYGFSVRARA
jgi:hypothetical protein